MNEEHFNGLSPAEDERLTILAEECAEVIQTICKIKRHGFESVDPTGVVKGTNRQQLEKELGDVEEAKNRLCQHKDVDGFLIGVLAAQRAGKCERFFHHQ